MLHTVLSVFSVLLAAVAALPAEVHINTTSFSNTTAYPLPNLGNVAAHDPNIIQYNGSFYLFKGGVHIPIHKASSLDGPWEQIGTVLHESSVITKQNRSRPWAPTTVEWDDRFFCLYAISESGSRNSAIGVASADSPESGNWTDHGALINTGEGALSDIDPYTISNAIDGAFIADQKTGSPHLLYGSYWHGIFTVPLADDLLSVKTPQHPNATNLAYVPKETVKPIEGSFMTYKAPYYYLWFSHGKCCHFDLEKFPPMGDEYSIRVGRSSDVTGPFVDKDGVDLLDGGGTVVYGSNHGVVYAPGGVGVLTGSGNDADVLYFHYLNTTIGFTQGDAQLGWNYLHYVKGWPVALEGYVHANGKDDF
ncbi:endo-1,5-alpha-L-arabinosidase [Aspergillus heteromorphus CBS 117.55]|uniref:Arabinan endo-1,5-alpha-L-arabinosidase n=1 Tax=Aspergillus heteromorphus CBS 117.55 TaxID=1448321 RepID=A0A317X2S4_9EURO|nr:endo-1,5-alpha-L-arabinosidase [Aspergillus heteromorphus CBS 117.55]PWY92645.1 endo-1,5-alpha-L-arabinosidase [Aspergillus heteromorphus CBS 117.55]